MGILDSIVEWIATQVMNLLDLITGSVLGALGCDMSTFLRYFPAAETLYEIFVAIGVGFILLNLVWQLFRNFGLGLGLSAEDPVKLAIKSILFIFLALFADQIMVLVLGIVGTPYDWVVDTALPPIEFASFASVVTVLVGSLVSGSVSLIVLILVLIVAWNYIKLLFEAAERYILVGVLIYTAPVAFATGASENTSNVFSAWCRMLGGQLFLLIMNAWCLRLFTSKTVYVERGKCAQIEWENSAVTGQIQIRKYSSEDNTVTGQLAGTPLEGAVFEITQARSGKVVGYIVTDARGVAASGPLPLGRYFVTEVSAPKYYQLSGEKMEAEIEYPSQIIKLSAYNKPAALGVTIKKSGNYEVQSGQTMSYDFSGIANTSNVALNHFFWHDRIPTDATRALSISTGTYNARLYYKVTFKTNLNDYRTLASNLLTSNNYSLSLNAATLRLVQGEYVTDVRFEFGTVPSGFSSVVKPTMRVQVLGTVSNGYQIINRADVGGQYLNEWQTAKTTWVTTVRRFNTTPLPKTGY